mgnify:CR=1 FL=1
MLRVDPQGKAFLLLDTNFEEVRSLRYDDKGVLYVAAVNGKGGKSAPPRGEGGVSGGAATSTPAPSSEPVPVVSVSTEITAVVVDSASSTSSSSSAPDRRSLKGGVYRIAPDGLWDKLWESREDSPYDVAFDAQNRLLIATGSRGKLYRLEGDPLLPTLIATAGGQQVTSLWRDGRGRVYYATANPGTVYRLAADRAAKGTYESETHDAGMVSSWGTISWRGNTPAGSTIEISTRSGNADTPNDTWSDWSAPYTTATGSAISNAFSLGNGKKSVFDRDGEGGDRDPEADPARPQPHAPASRRTGPAARYPAPRTVAGTVADTAPGAASGAAS